MEKSFHSPPSLPPSLFPPTSQSERALALFAFLLPLSPSMSMWSRLVHRMTTIVCCSSTSVSRSIVCGPSLSSTLGFRILSSKAAAAAAARALFVCEREKAGGRELGRGGGGGARGDSCTTHKINVCLTSGVAWRGPLPPSVPLSFSPPLPSPSLSPWLPSQREESPPSGARLFLPSPGRVGRVA